jgi:hypothetical protein
MGWINRLAERIKESRKRTSANDLMTTVKTVKWTFSARMIVNLVFLIIGMALMKLDANLRPWLLVVSAMFNLVATYCARRIVRR